MVFSLFVITSRFHTENTKLQCNFNGCNNVSICMLKNSVQFYESVHTVVHTRTVFFFHDRSITSSKYRQRTLLVDHIVRQVLPIASLIHGDTLGGHTTISRYRQLQRLTLSIFTDFCATQDQSNNIVAYYSPNSSQSNQTLCDVDQKWSLYDQ